MTVPVFLLGPLGRLSPLAPPEKGIARTDEMAGGVHTSVNGSKTLTVRGYRRVWEIESAHLEREDLSFLQACFAGAIRSPLRLVDPINKNRLSKSTSAAAKLPEWAGGASNWRTDATASTSTQQGDTPAVSFTNDYSSATSYVPETYIRWETEGAATVWAEVDGDKPLAAKAVPVFPGETLTLSAYTRVVSGLGSVTLSLRYVDASSTVVGTANSAASTATSWTRLAATLDAPADAVGAVVALTATAGGVYDVSQVQLEEGASASGWVFGHGCPEVLFTQLRETSPRYPLVTASLRLEER